MKAGGMSEIARSDRRARLCEFPGLKSPNVPIRQRKKARTGSRPGGGATIPVLNKRIKSGAGVRHAAGQRFSAAPCSPHDPKPYLIPFRSTTKRPPEQSTPAGVALQFTKPGTHGFKRPARNRERRCAPAVSCFGASLYRKRWGFAPNPTRGAAPRPRKGFHPLTLLRFALA